MIKDDKISSVYKFFFFRIYFGGKQGEIENQKTYAPSFFVASLYLLSVALFAHDGKRRNGDPYGC